MGSDAESQLRVLAEIGPMLASTLDYEETLERVAQVAVQKLADLAIIDVVDESGTIRRLKVAARDAAHQPICDGLAGINLDSTGPFLGAAALRNKDAVLMRSPRPEEIESLAHDDEDRRLLRSAGIRSLIATPLLAKGRLLGGIVFISSSRSRRYGPSDVRLAKELALRAALALDNARLYRAAQQAKAARDEMVAIVAHDLRNPLYSMLVNAELMSRAVDGTDTRLRQPLDRILGAATRMSRLINDLLDVKRIEAHGLPIDRRVVSVQDILDDIVESERVLALSASVSLTLDLSGQVEPVWADRQRVLQVMENLVSNALRFTPAGGTVVIGARMRGSAILFSVRDNGRGIATEDLDRVFDRFWQGRPVRNGAGLGLPIVKGIVEAHGGSVWLQSALGRGTTVFFTLPASRPGNGPPSSNDRPRNCPSVRSAASNDCRRPTRGRPGRPLANAP